MNINDDSAKRHCTSCQMCAAVCPKNAIDIRLDEEGFYRPSIDDSLCVDCGLCVKVCYKFDPSIVAYGEDSLLETTLYGASAKEIEIVRHTTSGGIADILAHELLSQGYKCVGVVYDSETDCVKDVVTSTEQDLIGFRGSKYIQSYTLQAFKEVVKTCKKDKYAVFGTPCHIYALDKYLRQQRVRESCMLIDLYCHGCPSMNIWQKYVNEIKLKIGHERLDYVNFRSKIKGWGSFYVVVVVDGKPLFYSDIRNNEFFDLFFSDQVLNEACNNCLLRSTLAYTDIRLGDFWGKQYVFNNKGVSAVSLVTDKAKALFESIEDKIYYKEERYEDFLPWQSWGKKHHPNPALRKLLMKQLKDDQVSLRESIDAIYRQQSVKQKAIRYVKNIVQALPISLEKRIRWFLYNL